MATTLDDGPGILRFERQDGVVHVYAVDHTGAEVAHTAGEPLAAMIRDTLAALDPFLGLDLGADPAPLIRRLLDA